MDLDTPPTPRYGPMEDPSPRSKRRVDTFSVTPRKGTSRVTKTPKTKTKTQTHPSLLLTPADTPVATKRAPEVLETTKKTGRVLFPPNTIQAGSGRARTHNNTPLPTTPRTPRVRRSAHKHLLKTKGDNGSFTIFSDSAAAKAEANGDDPFVCPDAPKSSATLTHPHQEKPDSAVPGLWYNFRGKKHYRPFKKGEGLDLQPKVLFKEELNTKGMTHSDDPFGGEAIGVSQAVGDNDSEAETDEDSDPLSSFSEEISSLS